MIQNKTHATSSHPSDFKQKPDLQLHEEKPSSKGLWRVHTALVLVYMETNSGLEDHTMGFFSDPLTSVPGTLQWQINTLTTLGKMP